MQYFPSVRPASGRQPECRQEQTPRPFSNVVSVVGARQACGRWQGFDGAITSEAVHCNCNSSRSIAGLGAGSIGSIEELHGFLSLAFAVVDGVIFGINE